MTKQRTCLVVLAIAIQASPPIAALFESSMWRHMLIQLPLLIGLGALISRQPGVRRWLAHDTQGYIAAAVVSVALVWWMLPVNLDSAVESSTGRLIKLVTVPLAGAAAAHAFRTLPDIASGVLALELWAMGIRSGWLYTVAPTQLCANYLVSEQQLVGQTLCLVAIGLAIATSCWFLFGQPIQPKHPDNGCDQTPA